jgi:hypothetical protein
MPDWEALVSARLGPVDGDERQRAEIIGELAGHLEDVYLQIRTQGLAESAAVQETLAQVADWEELARRIRLAKREEGIMNERAKGYWLPGLVCFTASMVLLMALQLSFPIQLPLYPKSCLTPPEVGLTHSLCGLWDTQMNPYTVAVPYMLWLLAQPIFGALGAYLSRRGGGERRARMVAGVFPALMFLFALGAVGVIAVFGERNRFVLEHPIYFATMIFPWVILPSLALALGAVPFLRERKQQGTRLAV